MLYRPAPPRPLRPDRRPSTVVITGISVEKLERLIEEIVQRAIRSSLAELEERLESTTAEDRT
jgi:DNA-binding MarR family transcriptional regulator